MLAEGRDDARIDDEVRSPTGRGLGSSSASRKSGSSSRGDAMRAKELLRKQAEIMCAIASERCDGNAGSSRRIAAVVVDPPLPKGGVPTTIS